MMITRQGTTKRVALQEFESVRPSGLIAIRLDDGDELGWARLTQGNDELILVTERGKGIRISEQDVRAMGRHARGVRAMRLADGDRIAVAEVIEPDGKLFLSSSRGYGRCTDLREFTTQHRGGKGVWAYRVTEATGTIVDGRVVQDEDEITLMSESGIILRTKIDRVPVMGRITQGVHMMDLKEGDKVASIARLLDGQDDEGDTEAEQAPSELPDATDDTEALGLIEAEDDLTETDDDNASSDSDTVL